MYIPKQSYGEILIQWDVHRAFIKVFIVLNQRIKIPKFYSEITPLLGMTFVQQWVEPLHGTMEMKRYQRTEFSSTFPGGKT